MRRSVPEPGRKILDRCGRTGSDDLDSPAGQVPDPSAEIQLSCALRGRSAVEDSLNAPFDQASDGLPIHLSYSSAMKSTIYHNPRCSKSRATLALLQERGADVEIIEYLKTPLATEAIRDLIAKLGLTAADVVRSGEPAFKDSGLSLDSGDAELIELMAREPIVMQRPIVVAGESARIGRPPENVLELFD